MGAKTPGAAVVSELQLSAALLSYLSADSKQQRCNQPAGPDYLNL